MLPLREIMVVIDKGSAAEARLEFAAAFAATHGARLVGFYVCPLVIPAGMAIPEVFVTNEMMEAAEKQNRDRLVRAKTMFDRIVERARIDAEWIENTGDPLSLISMGGRYTDIIVTSAYDDGCERTAYWLPKPEEIAIGSGLGTLVLPTGEPAPTGIRHVVIAWNASREAARAVREAMPILLRADRVSVAVVKGKPSDAGHGEEPGADICRYLARHGAHVTLVQLHGDTWDVSSTLLSHSFEIGADLLVAGCRGHSQIRDLLLGGTTRGLLAKARLPILLAN